MDQQEKRHNSRIQLDGHITVINREKNHRICRLHDLSMTGMAIVGFPDVKLGSSCWLESNLFNSGYSFALTITGRLVRQKTRTYGIRFLAMTRETLRILQTLLLYSSIDPRHFGEEFARESPAHLFSGKDHFLNLSANN